MNRIVPSASSVTMGTAMSLTGLQLAVV